MKQLCRFCAAIALACAFALPALAGEMHTGIAPPPPPPPPLTVEGEMHTGLADILLSFVETVISVG